MCSFGTNEMFRRHYNIPLQQLQNDMTVNSDSIQTLLKQRRQLRDCLKELKTEISQLNDKASHISEEHVDAISREEQASQMMPAAERGFDVPIMSTEKPVSMPNIQIPNSKQTTPKESSEKDFDQLPPRPLVKKISKVAPVLDTTSDVPLVTPKEVKTDYSPEPPAASSVKPAEKDMDEILKDAILLAGFFLHHPSAAGNQLLNSLDQAIQQTKALPSGAAQAEALSALKDAYRNVLSRTYPENFVTGQSISRSQKSNPYLFGIPMTIAALVLVVMPLLMLFQIIADRQFAPEMAESFKLLLNGMHSFVWGAVGSLSFIAINVTRLVRRRSYLPSRIAGVGMMSATSGILGIFLFVALSHQDLIEGTMLNYVQAIAAFGAGLLCSGCLQSVLSRKISLQ